MNLQDFDQILIEQPKIKSHTTRKPSKFWTRDEDEILKKAVENCGQKNWKLIAIEIPGKSSLQCLHRWQKLTRPIGSTGPWTRDEDEILKRWVAEHGPFKWSLAGMEINGRSGKQVRERWINVLCPGLKRGKWTVEEDNIIFTGHETYGPAWTLIATQLPGRNENAVKNRFHSTIRKMIAVKSIKEKLENAVVANKPAEKIVERHEIPMTIDDFVMTKTESSLEQLKTVIEDAEKFFQIRKLGDEPKTMETMNSEL